LQLKLGLMLALAQVIQLRFQTRLAISTRRQLRVARTTAKALLDQLGYRYLNVVQLGLQRPRAQPQRLDTFQLTLELGQAIPMPLQKSTKSGY